MVYLFYVAIKIILRNKTIIGLLFILTTFLQGNIFILNCIREMAIVLKWKYCVFKL